MVAASHRQEADNCRRYRDDKQNRGRRGAPQIVDAHMSRDPTDQKQSQSNRSRDAQHGHRQPRDKPESRGDLERTDDTPEVSADAHLVSHLQRLFGANDFGDAPRKVSANNALRTMVAMNMVILSKMPVI
jgi:hypothetical protein